MIEILEPGLLTTVQDLGRFGYQQLGIPTAGAMDCFALRAANAIVGNGAEAACLEITLLGPRLSFTEGCIIAITGADLGPHLDGKEIEGWRSYLAKPGSILEFSGLRSGARAYLAVSGGIYVVPWLGSRSTLMPAKVGGHEGRALRAGDRLPIGRSVGDLFSLLSNRIPVESRPPYSAEPVLRVVLGPDKERFTGEGIGSFLSGSYQIEGSSNRMGYRLEGPKITHTRGPDLISCGIPFGAIQVPGNGQPIILMADHQTMGGYTIIASVILADIPLVAQCLPGQRLSFRAVDLEQARDAYQRQLDAISTSTATKERSLW